MNTLTALLVFASHITANSTAEGGLNDLAKDSVRTTTTYGDQNVKKATLVNVRIFSVRRLPSVVVDLRNDGLHAASDCCC